MMQPTETVPSDSLPAVPAPNCSRIEEEEDVLDAPESVAVPFDIEHTAAAPLHAEKDTSSRNPPNTFKIPLRPSEPICIR